MMNLIQKFFSNSKNKSQIRSSFSHCFFSLPEHQWLKDGQTRAHFEKLLEHLPTGVLEVMMKSHPVTFTPSQNLDPHRRPGVVLQNTIVVFPEFQRLLQGKGRSAVAYLAHEVAFILYELEAQNMDPMMAEVEADKFVCDIGLADELEDLLLLLDETIEKRLRLTYLTINHFTRNEN